MPRELQQKRGNSSGATLSTARSPASNAQKNGLDFGGNMHALRTYCSAAVLFALLAGGCSGIFQLPQSDFWGVNVSDTQGAKTLTVDLTVSTSASTSVHLPYDLVDTSADSAKLVLHAKDITLMASKGGQALSAHDEEGTTRVEVTFYVAKIGQDACATGVAIGPIEVSIVDDQIQLDEGSVTLSGKAL